MRRRVVKWLCIAALFVAFVWWQSIADCTFPVVAVDAFHSAILAIVLACAAFSVSSSSLQSLPLLSVLSIADRDSGSDSL